MYDNNSNNDNNDNNNNDNNNDDKCKCAYPLVHGFSRRAFSRHVWFPAS